ncbi:MAG: hypothetical protein A2946_01410 [Candidatus Liptonbacteria bacterium RIFCSPLOWO2_01_FULL_53_13]|uniref:Uncharacterized protein n=1 Tax=Candidatus Liptonbacteria bacterium RIFCSPLOWO2_01_FULL_53_13 TaxID=1798651 RepID=A0A1G2CJX2_9BACT|nr:MAG: hypothetical protein A2946_01410 [Candidatus Liptonbacteria bacterium RIFCSPLOWO2_01_FULL_53_13]
MPSNSDVGSAHSPLNAPNLTVRLCGACGSIETRNKADDAFVAVVCDACGYEEVAPLEPGVTRGME